MTLFHDAYLFQLSEFYGKVDQQIALGLDVVEAYVALRHEAIHIYDQEPGVRMLSDEYGGWGRSAIVTQVPEQQPDDIDDIVFWLVILLYSTLTQLQPPLGLQTYRRLLARLLKGTNWSSSDVTLLVRGHPLGKSWHSEPRTTSATTTEAIWATALSRLRPPSMDGQLGWIARADCQRLLSQLEADEQQIESIAQATMTDVVVAKIALTKAIEMLSAAASQDIDLCVITSG